MAEPITISEAAIALENRILNHPMVQEWKKEIGDGTKYSDPWIMFSVDPINIKYHRRSFEMAFSILTKGGMSRVVIEFPYRKWRGNMSDTEISIIIARAIKVVEFMWNEHIFDEIGGVYPMTVMTIEA